jgi:hypothetical protein
MWGFIFFDLLVRGNRKVMAGSQGRVSQLGNKGGLKARKKSGTYIIWNGCI